MKSFERHDLSRLLQPHAPPCVTVTMPLHGKPPDSSQDGRRWAQLVARAKGEIESHPRHATAADAGKVVERLQVVGERSADDPDERGFWNRGRLGLVAFASPDWTASYQVPIALEEQVVVAESFHVKPLLPLLMDDARFHVLALEPRSVRLFQGNAERMEELHVPGVPRSMSEAIGTEYDDSHQGRSFHGSPDHGKGRGGGAGGVHFHGYGGSDGDAQKDYDKFFRAVDRAVLELVSQPSGLPLVLCALAEHHPVYRRVSHDAHLMPEGILQSPKLMDAQEIHDKAWALLASRRKARVDQAIEAFGSLEAHGLGSRDPAEIARAAVMGRVARLLLEKGRDLPGSLDRATGEVAWGGAGADVLDDLAELVLAQAGDVLIVDKERMPVRTGAAATYRY